MMDDILSDEQFQNASDDYVNLCHLVEEMTTTGRKELNEKHLKILKKILKKSEENVTHSFRLLMAQLGKFHSEIRYSAFQIIDQIFERSHLFRMLLVEEFHRFLELTVDINKDVEFPPPYTSAKELKLLALRSIARWDEKFGNAYQKLHLGCNYLRRVKKVEFADIRSRTLAERRQAEAEERRQNILTERKVEFVERRMNELQSEIESCIIQADNCLHLLVPDFGETSDVTTKSTETETPHSDLSAMSSAERSDVDIAVKGSRDLSITGSQEQGCGSNTGIRNMSYSISINFTPSILTIKEDENNSDILKTLSDLHNEIVKHHLPTVKQWANILTKARQKQDLLQRTMELKKKLMQVNDKYCELNIISSNYIGPKSLIERDLDISDDNDSEAEEFEDVPENPICDEVMGNVSKADENSTFLPGPSNETSNHKQHPLESSSPPAAVDEASSSRLTGKKRANWSCRAPLPNGLLCERQDLVKCPFHGKIVPRNAFGIPNNEEDFERDAKEKRTKQKKELDELQRDIELAKGITLSSDPVSRKKLKAARYSRLTNLEESKNTARNRLERKVLSKKALTKLADTLDGIDNRRNLEKYGCNFNYR